MEQDDDPNDEEGDAMLRPNKQLSGVKRTSYDHTGADADADYSEDRLDSRGQGSRPMARSRGRGSRPRSGRGFGHDSLPGMEAVTEATEAAEALIGLVGIMDGAGGGQPDEGGGMESGLEGDEGQRGKLLPGRIVWAKVEGHDWWPAKIVRRRAVPREVRLQH